jgi:hypothetical protein
VGKFEDIAVTELLAEQVELLHGLIAATGNSLNSCLLYSPSPKITKGAQK